MNINSIGHLNRIPNINFKRIDISCRNCMQYDTFERKTKPEIKNPVENLVLDSNFAQEGIVNILNNPSNELGHGFKNRVFAIPNNNEYVIRVPKSFSGDSIKDAKYEIKITGKDKCPVNVGQTVAEINYKDNDGIYMGSIEILKKQNGYSLGVPPYQAISDDFGNLNEGEPLYEDESRKEAYSKSLKALASLPVSTYSNLISDVLEASKHNLSVDYYNTNNFVLDEKNQKIGLVDMNNSSVVNWGNVLYALTNIVYYPTYAQTNQAENEKVDEVINNTLEIIDKFFKAMKEKNVKIKSDEISVEFETLLSSLPFNFYFFKKEGENNFEMLFLDRNQKMQKLKDIGVAE